ncbi:MAG: hypothetical protein BGO21_19975 [Dyadobacter sp. 50-39]|mgnify:CR=1 FL=1|nr:MAG: hypothetical protein BGO21_19975 [Dyadobacter sp. 50-39]
MSIMVLCLIITIDYCCAQTFNTPEISSIKQEVFKPVSYYTGQANISIPLTQVQTNEITIPVTLNYVGGAGLKPINPYSSVGVGWRVSAGGAITRSKNGVCDEVLKPNAPLNGFFSLAPNTVTPSYVKNNVNTYVGTSANGDKYFIPNTEYSPDVFTFSFLGYSGYFIMGYDGQFKIQSQDIVSVEKINVASPVVWPGQGNTISFKLTANDGTEFTFGGSVGSMELSGGTGSTPYQADAWYITEIKSVNGRTVTFNYQANSSTFVRFIPSSESNNAIVTNSPVVLDNIAFNGGTVLFTSSVVSQSIVDSPSNSRMISKIELKDPNSNVVSTSTFTYSENNATRYYFLDAVVVDGRSYTFGYYSRSGLPSIGTYLGSDYWGFYNGSFEVTTYRTGNVSSYWDNFLNATITYAQRMPSLDHTKRGVLTSITYPTGGVESYEYELNTYSYKGVQRPTGRQFEAVNEPRTAGGLRVSKVTLGDVVKKYRYVSSFNPNNPDYVPGSMSPIEFLSSGILYKIPGIPYFGRSVVNGLSIEGEPAVVYGKVIEFLSDKSYTEYTMRSPMYYPDRDDTWNSATYSVGFSNSNITGYFETIGFVGNLGKGSSTSLERGQVESMKVYDAANVLKKEVNYTYATDPNRFSQNVPVLNIATTADQGLAQLGFEIGLAYINNPLIFSVLNSYEVYTYPVYLEQEVEKSYESGNTLVKTTQYQYNSQKLRSEVSFTNSMLETIKTKIKYPADINTGVYASMVAKKMLNFPIEQVQLKNTSVTASSLNTYKSNANGSITYYVPDKKFRFDVTTPLAESSFTYFNGTTKDSRYNTTAEISYDSYSPTGNVRQALGRDGITTSYLWDASGVYPMAQVKGAAYATISSQDGKAASYSSSTLSSAIYGLAASALVTTYSYKPLLGIESVTDPSGKVTWYNYDSFGRLSDIRENSNAGNLVKSFHYNYANQGGWSSGIADDPAVSAPSSPGLISVTGCNFNISLVASSTTPNTGQQVTLTSSCAGGDCNGLSYSWAGQGSNGTAAATTFAAPGSAGSYNYVVTVARNGCTSKTATVTLNVQATGTSTCYTFAVASNNKLLSNHNGVPKVKDADGSASQIWDVSNQGSGFFKIVSKGSTNGTGIGSVLGVAGQGSSDGNAVDLQGSTTGDHQLWDVNAMTGSDAGRYKLVRKGTTLRAGSRFNWGAGDLTNPASDIGLANDPDNTYGSNKWIMTSVGCPGCNFNISLGTSATSPNTGQQVTLTSGCTGGDCSGLTYSWTGQGSNGTASSTTFAAPGTAGSYNYTVAVAKSGCTSKTATVTLTVQATSTSTCYTFALASNNKLLSNHNGVPKVKDADGSASQIWQVTASSTYFKIISKGSTNGTGIGSVLGVAGQGSSDGDAVDLQGSATGDHQLWDMSAMTGADAGRYKLVRKGTTLRIGSRFNWGAGDLTNPASDIGLVNDPDNTFGSNKWVRTLVGCPN